MKKIFYFIASAIVALGAVACQNEIDENIDNNQQTEGVSFYAKVKDITRVDIDNKTEAGYPVIWEVNDALEVSWYDEVAEEPHSYFFVYDGEKFTCNEEGVGTLNDKEVTVNYYASVYGFDSAKGKKGIMLGTNEAITFTPGCTINMELQCAFFHFSSSENVVLTVEGGDDYAFYYNEELTASTPKLTGEDIWVPFYVYTGTVAGTDLTLTATINGEVVKQITRNFANGKIYNLGTIEAPAAPAEKVYLVLNTEWKGDNAWFAAYFWNATTSANKSITMTDADADGIYECEVPADMDKVIFCRMNPQYTEFSWDVTEGEGESFKVLEDHVWNQTADLEIGVAPDNYYYIIGWESGLWGDENTDPTVSVAGQTSEWALVGAFSGWKDKNFITTATAGVVVLENVTMKAAEGFLVRKPSTDWADKYGASSINYLKANHFITTSKDGVDMCLEADGTYDFYFDANTKNIYIMTAGTDYNTATKQTANGQEPEVEEPEVTEKVVYLKPNSNWTQSNARFAAYFWGGTAGEKWVSMTAVGDGTYEVHLPEGYDYGCNIIFCRMNPSTTANNWNNKWNQTSDLKTPTDGKNLYTVKSGTWDKGGGTWSTK